jgi:hypothetical protein
MLSTNWATSWASAVNQAHQQHILQQQKQQQLELENVKGSSVQYQYQGTFRNFEAILIRKQMSLHLCQKLLKNMSSLRLQFLLKKMTNLKYLVD